MKKLFLLLSFLFFLFSLEIAFSDFVVPTLPLTPVYDEVGILSAEEKNELEQKIYALETETHHQIGIAIIKSLQGRTPEEASITIAREWKIGQNGVDNGLLIMMMPVEKPGNRDTRIEVGRGLEGVMTDLMSQRIIDENFTPHFKEGEYKAGLEEGIDRMTPILKGEVVDLPEQTPPIADIIIPILIVIFTFGWAFLSILSSTKSWWLGGVIGAIVGAIAIGLYGAIFIGIAGLILDYFLSKFGYQKISIIRDFQKRRGIGGGFGGFGGGSSGGGWGGFGGGGFGGGGASGKW